MSEYDRRLINELEHRLRKQPAEVDRIAQEERMHHIITVNGVRYYSEYIAPKLDAVFQGKHWFIRVIQDDGSYLWIREDRYPQCLLMEETSHQDEEVTP